MDPDKRAAKKMEVRTVTITLYLEPKVATQHQNSELWEGAGQCLLMTTVTDPGFFKMGGGSGTNRIRHPF